MGSDFYLTIPGEPIAKPRHKTRVVVNWIRKKFHLHHYNPKKAEEHAVGLVAKALYDGKILDEPLSVFFEFRRQIPQSWSKKRKLLAKRGLIQPISRPDTTNYMKFYEDAITKILMRDDAANIFTCGIKRYDDIPCTKIHIKSFSMDDYKKLTHT